MAHFTGTAWGSFRVPSAYLVETLECLRDLPVVADPTRIGDSVRVDLHEEYDDYVDGVCRDDDVEGDVEAQRRFDLYTVPAVNEALAGIPFEWVEDP